ncbi:MAG: TIGR04255 family protein [Gemmatimonadota bacterium]|nr:TIGR04255 family protein [Gemmatimonadota bacterium]
MSVVFETPVEASRLDALSTALRDQFPIAERLEQVQFETSVGPGGTSAALTRREFDGWQFKNEGPTRVVSAGRTRLSIHAARPGTWPTGPYAGWPAIYQEATELFAKLAAAYEGGKLVRAGLRYLNRIAVPGNSELEDWFTIRFSAPEILADPYAINLRQTWARIKGYDDLSATLGLAVIQIPDASLAESHIGFLLDIEVFNLWKEKAPTFAQLREWSRRAHEVERRIFEGSITDRSRELFGVLK